MKPLVFVIGPTASGKSSLAEELAQRYAAELVSMDSAQIYRGMDVGTAKPDLATREKIPHHLIDIRDPAQTYSAADFAADARRAIDQIHARGRLPVVVGGTFLYMRALLEGLHDMPAADPQLRRAMEERAAEHGWPALHAELAALDPQAARMIHPNDAQRIQRALEVAQGSGGTRTQAWQGERSAAWDGPVLKLAIVPPDRMVLRERIAQRFDLMMQQGFLAEVEALHQRGDLSIELPSMRSVGYRQLWQYLDGYYDLPTAVERGIIATRQYAKRQMTWLRREEDLCVLDEDPGQRLLQAQNRLEDFLAGLAA